MNRSWIIFLLAALLALFLASAVQASAHEQVRGGSALGLKPDPSGANTGGAADVVGASKGAPTADDMKSLATNEPLAMKLADVVGHNRIAINFVWILICGYLVFFMQAGFAMMETGFTRMKNAGHTMAMNMMVFVFGALGYWVCGYALQMGGKGFFLSSSADAVSVITLFFSQVVLMN